MASVPHKHYHDEEFDPKLFADYYWCSGKFILLSEGKEFPMKHLHEMCFSGVIKGETLLDFSCGPVVYQLFSPANVFKNIIVAELTDSCTQEFKKWLNKDPGCLDWSIAAKFVCQLEGNREGWQEEQDKVRRVVKQVMKWDVCGSRLDPLVPPVDCVLCVWILNMICKTKKDFQNAVKNLSSALKIGGYMLLFVAINMTYLSHGKHKMFILNFDEMFVKEALINAGFGIEKADMVPSKKGSDEVDYDSIAFFMARKEREV